MTKKEKEKLKELLDIFLYNQLCPHCEEIDNKGCGSKKCITHLIKYIETE